MAMKYDITLIPGDGVGPEVTAAAVRAVEATGIEIRWDTVQMGQATQDTLGTPLPESALASVRRNRVALKGPVTTPVGSGFRSANVALRKALDLYACVRPCKTYPGIPSPFADVDLVVVRENTEDLYSGIEFQQGTPEAAEAIELIKRTRGESVGQDSGLSIKAISETASRRIVRFAFEYARAHQPPEGDGRAQGQHPEVLGRAVPLGGPGGSRSATRTSSSKTGWPTT